MTNSGYAAIHSARWIIQHPRCKMQSAKCTARDTLCGLERGVRVAPCACCIMQAVWCRVHRAGCIVLAALCTERGPWWKVHRTGRVDGVGCCMVLSSAALFRVLQLAPSMVDACFQPPLLRFNYGKSGIEDTFIFSCPL